MHHLIIPGRYTSSHLIHHCGCQSKGIRHADSFHCIQEWRIVNHSVYSAHGLCQRGDVCHQRIECTHHWGQVRVYSESSNLLDNIALCVQCSLPELITNDGGKGVNIRHVDPLDGFHHWRMIHMDVNLADCVKDRRQIHFSCGNCPQQRCQIWLELDLANCPEHIPLINTEDVLAKLLMHCIGDLLRVRRVDPSYGVKNWCVVYVYSANGVVHWSQVNLHAPDCLYHLRMIHVERVKAHSIVQGVRNRFMVRNMNPPQCLQHCGLVKPSFQHLVEGSIALSELTLKTLADAVGNDIIIYLGNLVAQSSHDS
mmetsp:Transcript_138087/g.257613  ORF Transcript_138087/g.257613 Transcript_138087/m.257613 type:complete len:311 (-) Transcript_138087:1607-2539(-)